VPSGNRLPESKNSGKIFFFEKFFWPNCAIQSFLLKKSFYTYLDAFLEVSAYLESSLESSLESWLLIERLFDSWNFFDSWFFTWVFGIIKINLESFASTIYISKDFNVFSHLRFQKTTMSSFTFQKTSMSLVIYTLKRWQCLHLHFKRLQCLQSFTLSKDYNIFIHISKTSMFFVFYRTQCPCLCFIGLDVLCFYALKKKKKKELQMSSTLQNFNVLLFPRFHFLGFVSRWKRLAFVYKTCMNCIKLSQFMVIL